MPTALRSENRDLKRLQMQAGSKARLATKRHNMMHEALKGNIWNHCFMKSWVMISSYSFLKTLQRKVALAKLLLWAIQTPSGTPCLWVKFYNSLVRKKQIIPILIYSSSSFINEYNDQFSTIKKLIVPRNPTKWNIFTQESLLSSTQTNFIEVTHTVNNTLNLWSHQLPWLQPNLELLQPNLHF